MRRLLAACLAVAMCLSFCACGGGEESNGKSGGKKTGFRNAELVLAEANSIAEYADFSLFKVTTGKKITASIAGDIYYENDTEGETFVDMILDWTNTGTETVSSEDLLKAYAVNAGGVEYSKCLYAVETNHATYLSRYEDIAPLTTVRLHCAIKVPESEKELTLYLNVRGQKFVYEYRLGEVAGTAEEIRAGETVEVADYATLVFHGMEYTDDVRPSDTDGVYSHYEIDDPANTYLLVRFDLTSYLADDRECDTFVGIKAVYLDKYTYTGFAVVEDGDGRGFSAYDDIAPLTTRHFYYLIEVPKSVTENEVELTISFNGREYTYKGK